MISKWFYTGDDSGTGIYRIEIEENKISSMPQDDFVKGIRIPFRLESNPDLREKKTYITPLFFYANIKYAGESKLLGIAEACPVFEPTRNAFFDIPLSIDKVEFIEGMRQGKEIKFVLDVDGMFSVGGPGYSQTSLFSTGVFTKHLSLVFSLPKSVWEENILPNLGIEALHSITIRIPPGLRKPLGSALRELTDAVKAIEKATSESDFETVVGKARIAVESLLNQFSLTLPQRPDGKTDTGFKAKAEAMRDQLLTPVLGKTHAEHVTSVMISLWSPFSGATHPGPLKFDRAYARFSIHQAAALLSIVSETLAATG